ncbi:hypothetical protein YSA_11250 [Pseudomonas putida ND6]|uniref:Uncharacterized protein n=1 Tax=Pseudomonas putida ND6 TaxID=231023 RepID=I3V552_PSEPU|nr:hypothetical protein YSA_11250 [Pseudomonas putida ND6]
MRNEAGQRDNGPSEVRHQSNWAIRSPIGAINGKTGDCRMTCDAGSRGVPFATNTVTPAMLRVDHSAAKPGMLARGFVQISTACPAHHGALAGDSYAI